MKRGDLDYDEDFVYWKGKKYSRDDMKEGAQNLPWEAEAYAKTDPFEKILIMGYRQHNNPFSKSISPLQHNVRSATGEEWKHTHNLGRVSGRVDRGRLISGDADFNKRTNRAVRDERTGTKRLPDGSRATSENYAREYARQLADYYNKGYITGGQFLAQEFDKKKR